MKLAIQARKTVLDGRERNRFFISIEARIRRPSGNAERPRESNRLVRLENEMNFFFKWVVGLLVNLYGMFCGPDFRLYLRWSVKCCGQASRGILHPHANGVIRENAVNVSATAGDFLPRVWPVGHPAVAVL